MTKPLVERYEQILNQDPASTAFVELAKALIAKGDYARAIEVCQQGLSYHKDSVVGRVLWGKALIQLSRPAEAMEQFDQAIAIDRENPHAYNLIGEVLLHKGLYRSALPILKKAVALQPNDGRVRQWLEQTQRALAGTGPAPVVSDPTLPGEELESPAPQATQPLQTADLSRIGPAPENVPSAALTMTESNPAHVAVTAPNPSLPPEPPTDARDITEPPGPPRLMPTRESDGEDTDPLQGLDGPLRLDALKAPARDAAPSPSGALPPPNGLQTRTVPSFATLMSGMSFDEKTQAAEGPPVLRPTPADEPDPDATKTETSPVARPASAPEPQPGVDETVALSKQMVEDLARVSAEDARKANGKRELLEDIPPPPKETAEEPLPIIAPKPPPQFRGAGGPPRPPPLSTSGPKRALLSDIPEQPTSTAPIELPKVELSPTAAQAIAQEYERELREKLAEEKSISQQSFLAKHWRALAGAVVVGVVVVVGLVAYLQTRAANRGKDLKDALAAAKRGLAQDTRRSYREALEALQVAVKMAPSNAEAWALTAETRALLFAEHGGSSEDREKAENALSHPNVEKRFPGIALAVRYLLAPAGKPRETAARAVLDAKQLDSPEVQLLAGQILVGRKDAKGALERFKQANTSTNARALVALGEYARSAGDCAKALEFYASAGKISPAHPVRAVGAAECRLELGTEVVDALKDVEALPSDEELAPDLLMREELVRGRLLSAVGRHAEAVKKLSEGARNFGVRAFDFDLALGDARRAAGEMADAEGALRQAVRLKPKDEDARAALARVLLARDREHEALEQLKDVDGRKAALVRGMAYLKLNDFKKARAELLKTGQDNKFPVEAVPYLGLTDMGEGHEEQAQKALEGALGTSRKPRTELRVALGQIYWKRGLTDKAKAQFEEAMKDPVEYEAPCALGRLQLSLGAVDAGVEALTKAVARNPSHGEARHALGRAYLQQGRTEDGLTQADAWQRDNPTAAAALRDYAFALHRVGRDKEAEPVINSATRADPNDAEAHRVRAEILYARGNANEAMRALQAANKRDPNDAETFCAIGHAMLRQGKPDKASKAYATALEHDAQSACGRIGLLLAKSTGGKSAVKELTELGENSPRVWDRALAYAALAHVQLGSSVREARKAADKAVALDPQSGDAQLALGLVQMRQKDDAARAALEKAVEREPTYAAAHLALADLLSRSDEDLERARKEYEAFLKNGGGDPAEMSRVKRAMTNLKKRIATR